jgi:MFS family permease
MIKTKLPHWLLNPINAGPWLIWGSANLYYAYQSLLQVSHGVMAQPLMHDFGITAAGLGIINSAFMWSYALSQLPAGILYDRFQTRDILCSAILTCAFATYLHAIADTVWLVGLARFLMGLGSAFAALGCLKLAQLWFPAHRFAMLTGLTLTLGMLGQMLGAAPLSLTITAVGWRPCLHHLAIVGLLITLVAWFFIQKDPHNKKEAKKTTHVWKQLSQIIKDPNAWIIALYGLCMFAPFLILSGLWGVSFTAKLYQLETAVAATHFTAMWIGFAIGAPVCGGLSDGFKRRRPPMILSALTSTILLILMVTLPMPIAAYDVCLFCLGFCISAFLPAFSVMKEITPKESKSMALGFMNTLNSVGGAVFAPIVGLLMDFFWNGAMSQGVPEYSLLTFKKALIICPVFTMIALAMSAYLPETFAKDQDQSHD